MSRENRGLREGGGGETEDEEMMAKEETREEEECNLLQMQSPAEKKLNEKAVKYLTKTQKTFSLCFIDITLQQLV